MSRTIDIDPVTRIEGHGKVHIEINDSNQVEAAFFHILEFRGFERFLQGMQIELLPTITTRICGTCPHAHHLVSAKAVDAAFSVTPPRPAILLRELMNAGSFMHSHAVHFFALAGPDLILGLDAPAASRNILGLLQAAPDLASKALRLRSLGQKIAETIGGRGTHPVSAVAGGMAIALTAEKREILKKHAAEALELAKVAMLEGKKALAAKKELLSILPLATHNMGTVRDGKLDLYDGKIRVRRPDGTVALEFASSDYKTHLFEKATRTSYSKQVFFKDPSGKPAAYRTGPLARLNCVESLPTPLAQIELEQFKAKVGNPCNFTVMNHYARLIELLYCAERAVEILADDEVVSTNVRTKLTATPRPAVAHIEAPRGVLIHDYDVDQNGIVTGVNMIVATQHNVSSINASIKAAAQHFIDQPDEVLLNGIEFAVRCYDPCLSCSTHQLGQMALDVSITNRGELVRRITR
jgi:F420-non-reducing hydrogenase large subunit